ncbi:class IIb bacteriocin, lactobin A/cerein 7B family [Hymenobacter latericus]|uniref:class IIb bacteriocin, lactobin A/cerein 7B family n=1 Tax=Hymenobacter sp. YIM 151858-1 TaxID=2987688 RepID=UPI0022267E45|nr:class IIb bacteriocin, lactobin A/cerein 7B family [Hymenobacter sp. YIM 151858-1]UYZ58730.1 class IIb bacteriocin, lactobin A/cerein 7B family [Hymenobacter sp. YIM 151858-1]
MNKTLDLNNCNVAEMSIQELEMVDGGLFPLVIGGYVITAKAAGWAAAGLAATGIFAAGVYSGYQDAAK